MSHHSDSSELVRSLHYIHAQTWFINESHSSTIPATAMHMTSHISSRWTSHSNRSLCTNLNYAEVSGSSCLSTPRISRKNSQNLLTWSHRSNLIASPNCGEETRTLWEGPLSSSGLSFFSSCCSFIASPFSSCNQLSINKQSKQET